MKRKCKECRKLFITYPCKIKKGKGKFCSVECSNKAFKYHKIRFIHIVNIVTGKTIETANSIKEAAIKAGVSIVTVWKSIKKKKNVSKNTYKIEIKFMDGQAYWDQVIDKMINSIK